MTIESAQRPASAGGQPGPTATLPGWDCHAHLFGPYRRYPLAAERSYTPPEADIDAYLAQLAGLGLGHGVLVQPRSVGGRKPGPRRGESPCLARRTRGAWLAPCNERATPPGTANRLGPTGWARFEAHASLHRWPGRTARAARCA